MISTPSLSQSRWVEQATAKVEEVEEVVSSVLTTPCSPEAELLATAVATAVVVVDYSSVVAVPLLTGLEPPQIPDILSWGSLAPGFSHPHSPATPRTTRCLHLALIRLDHLWVRT